MTENKKLNKTDNQKNTSTAKNDDLWRLIDLYFNEKFTMYKYQYDGYSQFVEEIIYRELKDNQNLIYMSDDTKNNITYKYKFEFDNIYLQQPIDDVKNELIFPEHTRIRHLTYSSKLFVDVKQIQEIINFNKKTIEKKVIAEEKNVPIARIPLMVRSKYCSTNIKKDYKNVECVYDPGCYFIVKGSEKIVLALERICENKILIFAKKETSYKKGITYTATVNSKQHNINANIQIAIAKFKKDDSVLLSTIQFGEVPVCIIFRALGIETDKDIANLVVYDNFDNDMLNVFQKSLLDADKEEMTIIDEITGEPKTTKIKTQDQAVRFLARKLKDNKKYTTYDVETKEEQKILNVYQILANDFLPHMGTMNINVFNFDINNYNKVFILKVYYLGLMIHKLLNCFLERSPAYDRDSYLNKRIDVPGALLGQLFRQYYRKMIVECQRVFKKRHTNDLNPVNIINQIKSTTIEQGINIALSTGQWGSNRKKGVAQVLQRLTFLFTLSYLRRITIAPQIDNSNSKVVSIRHANNIQYGFIDLVETPDGSSVGLIKNLALTANVSLYLGSQYEIVKNIINKFIESSNNTINNAINMNTVLGNNQTELHENIDLIHEDLNGMNKISKILATKIKITHQSLLIPNELKKASKIFLNGEWLGCTYTPVELTKYLRNERLLNHIDKTISISLDYFEKEIRINTDGGRLYRPLLRVKNNSILVTKEMIQSITLNNIELDKINTWNKFIQKFPYSIEYIDIEESEFSMIGMYTDDIVINGNRKLSIIKKPNPCGDPVNRYNDTMYKNFTHCELHPMLMLGVLSSNIPFCEHNTAARNYYNFAQARHGLGLFATNYRHRIDISYLLYYPQIPIVTTKAAEYSNLACMPNGENIIVAIACYTGYNQEDSLVVNGASLNRGMFLGTAIKKYVSELKKNTMTAQDDIFMKPDERVTQGIKEGNYNKLNEKGYVDEETVITNGDVIIGKVSPVQQNELSGKMYSDDSVTYHSNVDGVVDKVYNGVYNNDGFETKTMRIRSERQVMQGDKFSSRHGQKGTCGIILNSADMPFTENGIQPDIIINPHCIPGRMTVAQLLECVLGKASVLEGRISDATPFNKTNIDEANEILKKNGFDEYGVETLYCGFTGRKIETKIFIGPTFYMRLKHMVLDKLHCLTPDHDVLTDNGWKNITSVTTNDKVATLNNNVLEYNNPISTMKFNYNDDLYNISSDTIDLSVTKEHKMYVYQLNDSNSNNSNNSNNRKIETIKEYNAGTINKFKLETPDKIFNKPVLYQKSALWNVPNYQLVLSDYINLYKKNIDMNAFIKFFALWIDCGNYNNYPVFSHSKTFISALISNLLHVLNFDYAYIYDLDSNNFQYIVNDPIFNNFINYLNMTSNKYIPQWVFNLSADQSKLFIKQMLLSNLLNSVIMSSKSSYVYFTDSITIANDLSALCLHAGYSGDVCKNDLSNHKYKVNIYTINNAVVNYHVNCYEKYSKYNGNVFCITVPNSIFYVRRNGKCCWTGNSRSRGPVNMLTRQPMEGRAKDGGLRIGEMERDAIVGHGMAQFLKERFMETADKYVVHICNHCGIMAHKKPKKDNVYVCDLCKRSDISKCVLPYAAKLMIQELMSINILPRIRPKLNY